MRVLLVDMDDGIRNSMKEFMRRSGHEITMARTGQEAIQILGKKGVYDFIIADYHIGHVSGVDVLKLAKETSPGAERWLTAASNPEGLGEAIQFLGIKRVISKMDLYDNLVGRGLVRRAPAR